MLYNKLKEKIMAKQKKQFTSNAQKRRHRNWLAVRAHFKTGAGSHGSKKAEANKKACRGRVNL